MKITCNMKADEATIMDKEGKVGRKVAEGWVEIEDCFRFPVIVRTYQYKETKNVPVLSTKENEKWIREYCCTNRLSDSKRD